MGHDMRSAVPQYLKSFRLIDIYRMYVNVLIYGGVKVDYPSVLQQSYDSVLFLRI
jgi:hypothetical protein